MEGRWASVSDACQTIGSESPKDREMLILPSPSHHIDSSFPIDFTLNRRRLLTVTAGGLLSTSALVARPAQAEAAFLSAVGKLLREFVIALGVEAVTSIAPNVFDWVSGLWEDEQRVVEEVHAGAANHGFSDCSHSPVYGNHHDPLAFYTVEDGSGLNACVPIFAGGIRCPAAAMIHGPVTAGITSAAQDWPHSIDLPAYCGLLPIEDVYPDTAHWFQHTSESWYVARTPVGYLESFYQSDNTSREGEVWVVSRLDDGTELFNGRYPLVWGTT
jgi:hypothetical protein